MKECWRVPWNVDLAPQESANIQLRDCLIIPGCTCLTVYMQRGHAVVSLKQVLKLGEVTPVYKESIPHLLCFNIRHGSFLSNRLHA